MKTKIAYWICQCLGWGAYCAVGVWAFARSYGWQWQTIVGYFAFFVYSIALTDLLRREMKRRLWLLPLTGRSWAKLVLCIAVLTLVQTFLVFAVSAALRLQAVTWRDLDAVPLFLLNIGAADICWCLLYVAATGGRRHTEREVHLQLALREAELRALEAQINPHFLFNCLNSIRGLVVENPARAQDMITRFANILRYNLQRDLTHTVPLASELAMVSDYLALETLRLEERLRVSLEIDPAAATALVPPMLLQTLVENAVKHGVAPLPRGGELVVRARVEVKSLVLEVENSGQLAPAKTGVTRVGLANTRDRLRILYGDRAKISLGNRDSDRVLATVTLPTAA